MTDDHDGSDSAVQLSKLTARRNSGAITSAEFETEKRRLLSQPPVSEEGFTLEDLRRNELELDLSRPPASPPASPSGSPPPPPPPEEGAEVATPDPPREAGAPRAPEPLRAVKANRAAVASAGSIPRVVWLAGGGGLGVVVLLLVLFVGLRGRLCGGGRGGSRSSSATRASAAGAGMEPGVLRWSPGDPFSCAALQARVDGTEDDWVDQLELLLKRKGILAAKARISVDRPQVAVKQAQTLVFERGELHRCQVAQKQRRPAETRWLDAVKRCFAHKKQRRFTICHVTAFLEHVGQLPFSCRFYCNKEMYQCGAEVVASSVRKQRGFPGGVDDDGLDRVRPRLFASCLGYCKKKLQGAKIRESVLQCMFQPTCKGFVDCLKEIPGK